MPFSLLGQIKFDYGATNEMNKIALHLRRDAHIAQNVKNEKASRKLGQELKNDFFGNFHPSECSPHKLAN